ncbi:MAG: hypothetical protein LBG65_02820 [Puniceicoccales bacterium]|jgi:hypothetical protein|nr:hypothetical protein [Puniceicoccales bacterium]
MILSLTTFACGGGVRAWASPKDVRLTTYTDTLDGEWRFAFDPKGVGIAEKWFAAPLPGRATITLPGTTAAVELNGGSLYPSKRGHQPSPRANPANTPTPPLNFCGKAWYQREILIREEDAKKYVRLELELPRSKATTVWFDDEQISPTNYSISTPQRHALTNKITHGKHRITILVDNSRDLFPRHKGTAGTGPDDNWNGILGRISIRANEPAWIKKFRVLPDFKTRQVHLETTVEKMPGYNDKVAVSPLLKKGFGHLSAEINFSGNVGIVKQTITNNEEIKFSEHLWAPACDDPEDMQEAGEEQEKPPSRFKSMQAVFLEKDHKWKKGERAFYICDHPMDFLVAPRDVTIVGKQFFINGRPVFLRGRHDALVSPAKRTMPMDKAIWEKYLSQCKSLGINYIKFDSFCPPGIAFEIADKLCLYLHVEFTLDSFLLQEGKTRRDSMLEEARAILDEYGNHPSFVFLGFSKDLLENRAGLDAAISELREYDHDRRLYLAPSILSPQSCEKAADDKEGTASFAINDISARHIHTAPPSTLHSYDHVLSKKSSPQDALCTIGPYPIYPDFDKTNYRKLTLAPSNMEALLAGYNKSHAGADSAGITFGEPSEKVSKNNKPDSLPIPRWKAYALASANTAFLCHKEAVETVLRTQDSPGFIFGKLQKTGEDKATSFSFFDFPMERKFFDGIPESLKSSWRHFCAPIVPLARFETYTYNEGTVFTAEIQVANHSFAPLENVNVYTSLTGYAFNETREETMTLPCGKLTTAYTFYGPDGDGALATYNRVPDLMTLEVRILDKNGKEFGKNSWKIWVYPFHSDPMLDEAFTGIHVTSDISSARRVLDAGGKVLLLNPPSRKTPSTTQPPQGSARKLKTIHGSFGIPIDNPPQQHQNKESLGVLIANKHPIFSNFPTESHGDWQWWGLIQASRPHVLDPHVPAACFPIVQSIDSPLKNRKLGLVYEGRGGTSASGKILVCAIDEVTLRTTPEGRHFLMCAAAYMHSPAFNPKHALANSFFE